MRTTITPHPLYFARFIAQILKEGPILRYLRIYKESEDILNNNTRTTITLQGAFFVHVANPEHIIIEH